MKIKQYSKNWFYKFLLICFLFSSLMSLICLIISINTAISFFLGCSTLLLSTMAHGLISFFFVNSEDANLMLTLFYCGEIVKFVLMFFLSLLVIDFFDINVKVFVTGIIFSCSSFLWAPTLINLFK